MEDTKIVVCRLCLNFTTFDECQILDTVSKDMLTFIMPETDLDISHDPKICQTCYKTMLRCYRFKSNYNKDIKTETKKKLDTEGSEMISIQVEEVESKCNFCSSSIDDESREEFSNRKTYFTEVLQKYLPERNLSSKALFCKKCLDDLTSQFTFITKCTDTENKLKDYRLTHGTNSEGKLNLYEALQQILCKEDTDLITAIKTDGDMSCEDLFEGANNEVPFPEVDVKTETLKMEEVDIKSEPYDEESIITSESEGSITGSERHLEKSQLKRTVDDADGSPSTKRCRKDTFQACFNVTQTRNTETNIAKEHGFTPFKKHRQYTPLLEDFIENDRNQIRRIVHSFFLRHEQPTVEKIQAVLSENEHLPPLSNIILMRVLNEINFRIKGKRQCKFIKERDETIIWRRRYLTQIKAYREEQRPIYYLDEMSIYVVQDSKGKSFTVLHICSEDGFLADGLLMFESKVVEDQNKKIKIAAFEDWFPKILPKLKAKAVIVLHNAPCHSRPLEEFPNGTMHKVEIQKWLSSKNIAFEEDMVKLELLDLVKKAKPLEKRYVVDEMAKANNKNVLRLPPYHYELNPLKTIWPQIKSEVSNKNSSCQFEEVREVLVDAIARVSAEQWQKAISDVLEVEKELWQLDIDMEEQMEALLADCSGTESESESD
ncbi:uncharacterized protein LOC108907761 [Anoplophora glabripennis]|uniref:uncharacterized protein LOC108907761 n=1 Tax=Anoplophora glabripennis TaxID=217634 RepID=UPI00087365F8|nr:uncharacterized protein LOC108907761 [Anoplophora glabripennis]